MIVADLAEAQRNKRRVTTADGLETGVSIYFGVSAADNGEHPGLGTLFPVAYRIDQYPGTQADPHFHQANQFQVFVDGAGHFGKQPVSGVVAHYSQAFTPYGPIQAGERGLSYLTLRNGWDPGGQFMPAQRELLRASGRRPRAAASPTFAPAATAELAALTEPKVDEVLAAEADGLGGWRYRVPPGQSLAGPASAGGGQYWIVLAGSDVADEQSHPAMSCRFLAPDDPARTATAGPDGLDVLILQFPRP